KGARLRNVFMAGVLLVLLQVLSGILLVKYGLLSALQPVHLLLSCVLFGLQFYFVYGIFDKRLSIKI
ncbi:MAG TPA: hypothetical protein VD772_09300, partial [Anseongella sp.]|nr:hypothetical protein [Anseongella sp.]